MKYPFLFLSFIFSISYGNAICQCIANAGPDRVICTNDYGVDTTQIGAIPAATGGIPPYSYTWEANYSYTIGSTTITKTASYFLNDTTIPNPLVITYAATPVTFILTVKDSTGNICKDTAVIKFSKFIYTLSYLMFTITQGDSIFLNYGANVFGNFPPFQYVWRPNHGLTDSTHLSFWAKPEHSVAYYVTMTDSAGCSVKAAPYYCINVSGVGLEDVVPGNSKISVFPNPSHGTVTISVEHETHGDLLYEIFDIRGKLVKSIETKSRRLQLNPEDELKGNLFYRITENGKILGLGKMIFQ